MTKLIAIALMVVAAFGVIGTTYAQTTTPTATASPTPTATATSPSGAPNTGFGGN